jgi:RNA polymerase-binding transcription factor DksA
MLSYRKEEERLTADLARITAELSAIARHNPTTDDWEAVPDIAELSEADQNTEADTVEEWNERRATLASLEIEYRDIKRALAKIAAGTYGVCEIAGEPIEPERLAFKPTARTCQAHLNEEHTLPL